MRQVTLRPAGETFENWQRRAAEARDALIAQWKTAREVADREKRAIEWQPSINDKLYKELRQVFLNQAFHNKCAYCEANSSGNYPIQVEHYRPKAEVTENRRRIDHTGYFWLAYEWWNLVPSCSYCNTDHTDPLRGQSHPGKKNEFPVGAARVGEPSANPAQRLAELEAEGAALLNPYFDNPEKHINFEPATGAVVPVSPRGKATVEFCDLSRPSLCEKRRELRTDALNGMAFRIMNGEDLDSVVPPSKEFSLWRRRLVQEYFTETCSRIGLRVTRLL